MLHWKHLNLTVEEGITQLGTLCVNQVKIQGRASFNQIPVPSQAIKNLLDAALVKLPKALSASPVAVSTKNKLEKHRK